jgi:hypothetical protein
MQLHNISSLNMQQLQLLQVQVMQQHLKDIT